jgi:hypothetical protein
VITNVITKNEEDAKIYNEGLQQKFKYLFGNELGSCNDIF